MIIEVFSCSGGMAEGLRRAGLSPKSWRRCWLDDVRPGDVVRFKSGALRTALTVSRTTERRDLASMPAGLVFAISFPILRCSWHHRGHTTMCRVDLLQRAECLTRARIRIERYAVARALLADMTHRAPGLVTRAEDIVAHHEPGASCCDVIGVFS